MTKLGLYFIIIKFIHIYNYPTACVSAPYQVVESGYGGFVLPVDIHLRVGGQGSKVTSKVRSMYTLFLGVTPSVSNVRKEIITFLNPDEAFYHALMQAGGVSEDYYHDDDVVIVSSPPPTLKRKYDLTIASKKQFGEEDYSQQPAIKKRRPGRPKKIVNDLNSIKAVLIGNEPARKRGRPKRVEKPHINNHANQQPQQPLYKQIQIDQQFKKVKLSHISENVESEKTGEMNLSQNTNSNTQQQNSMNMSSFIRSVNNPLMTSTPMKKILKQDNVKKNLKLRFKPTVEEVSFEEDEERVVINEDIHSYKQSLAKQVKLTPLNDVLNAAPQVYCNQYNQHVDPQQQIYCQQHERRANYPYLQSQKQHQQSESQHQQFNNKQQPVQSQDTQFKPQQQQQFETNDHQDIDLMMLISQKLSSLTDRKLVRKVIKIIQNTGLHTTSKSSFDFDLCNIDAATLNSIRVLLCV